MLIPQVSKIKLTDNCTTVSNVANASLNWSYNSDVAEADSIKERVKNAGGKVTGDLRISF